MTTVLGSLLTDAVRIEGLCGGLETCICDGDDDAQNAILPLVQVVRAKLGDLCNALDKLDGSSQFSLRAPAPTSALAAPTGSSGSSDRWEDRFNTTDTALIRLEGLTTAAVTVADQHPGLNNPSPESTALTETLRALADGWAQVRDLRSAEYAAGFALRREG